MNPFAPDPIREPQPAPIGDGGPRPGASVWIEWRGTWWPGTVLHTTAHGRYRVHYTGYSERWNEDVGLERLAPYDRPPPGPRARMQSGGCIAVLFVVLLTAAIAIGVAFSGSGPPTGSASIASLADVREGEPVWVEWHGSWYEGVVRSVNAADGVAHVHYDGYSDGSDEDVTLDRLRTR